jgi:hypothetical protein
LVVGEANLAAFPAVHRPLHERRPQTRRLQTIWNGRTENEMEISRIQISVVTLNGYLIHSHQFSYSCLGLYMRVALEPCTMRSWFWIVDIIDTRTRSCTLRMWLSVLVPGVIGAISGQLILVSVCWSSFEQMRIMWTSLLILKEDGRCITSLIQFRTPSLS